MEDQQPLEESIIQVGMELEMDQMMAVLQESFLCPVLWNIFYELFLVAANQGIECLNSKVEVTIRRIDQNDRRIIFHRSQRRVNGFRHGQVKIILLRRVRYLGIWLDGNLGFEAPRDLWRVY